jgi:VanZ family protein
MELAEGHILSALRSGLSGQRSWLWPLLLTIAITWETVEAVPSVGPAWLSFDKLAHFAVFGLLATALARLEQAPRWPLLGPLWSIVLVSVYGFGDELLQGFTPDRSMEFADWVADTLGAAVAVVVYLRWNGYRRVLEMPLRRRHQPRVEISPESGPNPPG